MWALIVIVMGVIFLGVGLPFALDRGELSRSEVTQINDRLATQAAAEAAAAVERRVDVLIVGDSYTAGSQEGGQGAAGWAALVEGELTQQGYDIGITTDAAGGSGYVNPGPQDVTFPQLVESAPDAAYDLAVFFGSRNDAAAGVEDAATEALTTAQSRWPEAELLVIGPPWANGDPPSSILATRDAVEAAANDADATFVDPLAEDWFAAENEALIGADGIHPTDDGHQHMADLIEPHIVEMLPPQAKAKNP